MRQSWRSVCPMRSLVAEWIHAPPCSASDAAADCLHERCEPRAAPSRQIATPCR
jgi:hypothetical protein